MFQEQLKSAFESERDLVIKDSGRKVALDSIIKATHGFYGRLDNTITGASEHVETEIQCKKGCSYCCHFRVDVSANEVFAITEYAQSTFTPDKLEKLAERAKSSSKKLAMLSQAKRVITNIACPLLEDGTCSVYEVRPSMCRKIHSTNVDMCQQSYDNPQDKDIENAEHPVLAAITMTMLTAAREGFSSLGLDKTVYDLNEVLIESLADNKYKKRWLNGKKAFP